MTVAYVSRCRQSTVSHVEAYCLARFVCRLGCSDSEREVGCGLHHGLYNVRRNGSGVVVAIVVIAA